MNQANRRLLIIIILVIFCCMGLSLQATAQCTDNSQCGVTEYCAKTDGLCGEMGACQPMPVSCDQPPDPVCGCDGLSYVNSCEAALNGQSVYHTGVCPNDHQVYMGPTDLFQGMLCNGCHNQFYNNWSSANGINDLHNVPTNGDGSCATCHNATRDVDPCRPIGWTIQDVITYDPVPIHCLDCHETYANPSYPHSYDSDQDGYSCTADCNDFDPNINPGNPEICDDGFDNDCNGLADCDDLTCAGAEICQPPSGCPILPDRKSCNRDPACSWNKKSNICEDAGGGEPSANCRDLTEEIPCITNGCNWNPKKGVCR